MVSLEMMWELQGSFLFYSFFPPCVILFWRVRVGMQKPDAIMLPGKHNLQQLKYFHFYHVIFPITSWTLLEFSAKCFLFFVIFHIHSDLKTRENWVLESQEMIYAVKELEKNAVLQMSNWRLRKTLTHSNKYVYQWKVFVSYVFECLDYYSVNTTLIILLNKTHQK